MRLIKTNLKEFDSRALVKTNKANKDNDNNINNKSDSKIQNGGKYNTTKSVPEENAERAVYFYARLNYLAALEACEKVLSKKNFKINTLPENFLNIYAECLIKTEVNISETSKNFLNFKFFFVWFFVRPLTWTNTHN